MDSNRSLPQRLLKTNSGFISKYDFDESKIHNIELILEPNKRVGLAPYDCEFELLEEPLMSPIKEDLINASTGKTVLKSGSKLTIPLELNLT